MQAHRCILLVTSQVWQPLDKPSAPHDAPILNAAIAHLTSAFETLNWLKFMLRSGVGAGNGSPWMGAWIGASALYPQMREVLILVTTPN